MQYLNLGHSGLNVSRLSLGSWLTYGQATDPDVAFECLNLAREAGITLFDTANIYNQGAAELLLGDWLQGIDRTEVILATKAFFPTSGHRLHRGLSYRHLFNAVQDSLERLQTDYIDLYQCHRYDDDTPLEETCFAMHSLIESGAVLYWGVSQWTGVQIVNALRICERHNWRKPIANQPIYNMLNRSLEVEVMEVCHTEGLGLLVFSPLAQGILTGKYRPNQPPPAGSRAANPETTQWFAHKRLNDTTFGILSRLEPLARELGTGLPELALAWTLRYPAVTTAIVGASSPDQLKQNLKALDVVLNPELLQRIEDALGNAPVDQYTGQRVGWGVPKRI